MDSTREILTRLAESEFEFVIIGGIAAILYGSSMPTEDLDLCAPFTEQNLQRFVRAIGPLNPYWRSTPRRPPLDLNAANLSAYKNLYILTDWGAIDVLSEVNAIGGFDAVKRRSTTLPIESTHVQVLDLDALIETKRDLNRPQDQKAVIELEALRQRRKR